MANALFAFDTLDHAQRAAERAAARLPPEAVSVHTKDLGRSESLFDQADETVVSGGMLRNLYDLFQGIFEWGCHRTMPATSKRPCARAAPWSAWTPRQPNSAA